MLRNLTRAAIHLFSLAVLVAATPVAAQQPYQRPPREIVDILDAPAPPVPVVSPAGNAMILATPVRYRPISDLAEPMFPGAGIRINPRNNGHHLFVYYVALELQRIPDGTAVALPLPAGARVSEPRWNASGTMFAFSNATATSVDLWVGDAATANIRRIDGVRLNPLLSYAIQWMPDQKTLLVKTVPAERGAPPSESSVPPGPRVEDTSGTRAAGSTYEAVELLKTPYLQDVFAYYTASQVATVDPLSGRITPIGNPAVLFKLLPAPGGRYLLVERLERPYSSARTFDRFPAQVEVWDLSGKKVETLASQPLAEVPIDGVRTGPRDHAWRATAPATVVWIEALDDGDPYKKVPDHDRVMLQPVGGSASELVRTGQRFESLHWIDQGGLALLTEVDYDKRWFKTVLLDADQRSASPKVVWSQSYDDAYQHPGEPVFRRLPNGAKVIREFQGAIFTAGEGASPAGNRPFLDHLDLRTLKRERLFRSAPDALESFIDWVSPATMTFLTRRESPRDPPNVYMRSRSTSRQLTRFVDPNVQLRRISKRLVTYQRSDGVQLSFTLYLPPGYQAGTRLPTVVWAYPLNYTSASTAGQVAAAPQTFTTIDGASPIFLALEGYAVLDSAAMPVVGPTETAYDTFIEQIVASAKAAVDKAVELGVTDRDRVGIIGHSHGALTVANLLAWSDLFRAGVARSGAYNHTLRPFGFQNERRTLYQARDTYLRLSPLLHADRIKAPLLIIHGERDNNPGTVPLQSERLFDAIRGVGGTARLVMLPLEPHGYLTRESVEHTLYETLTWFDRHVKNAPPR